MVVACGVVLSGLSVESQSRESAARARDCSIGMQCGASRSRLDRAQTCQV